MALSTEERKERRRLYQAAYAKQHPEKIAAKQAAYRKANLDKLSQYNSEYKKANPEKVAAHNAKYYKANPAKVTATEARKRAIKLQATPRWASKHVTDTFYTQAQHLSFVTGVPYHVDHIVPLRSPLVCGLHVEHNLQVIPSSENCSKGNRHWPDMP